MRALKTSKKRYQVQVTYAEVIAYTDVSATSLEDALEQSKTLKLGTLLAEGLDEILDYSARVSGVYEAS